MNEAHKKDILNEILKHHESLRPSKYWMQRKNFRNLISALYREYKDKQSKCCICNKSFHNNFVRDYHINNIHHIEVLYSCEMCEFSGEGGDNHFKNIYQYFGHKNQYHGR